MKIIIVGCGRMGAGLAVKLCATGHFVTVIDSNPASFELLGSSINKCQTLTGMGFDNEVLLQAKIERAEALAALTTSDDANIVIARVAKTVFNVPNVIARLCDISKTDIYHRLGLKTIDPITWGVDRVSEIFCCTPMATIHSIGNGNIKIVEATIPSFMVGKPVLELFSPGEFQVTAITRESVTMIPAPDETLKEKDIVHLSVESSHVSRLRELLDIPERI